MGCEDVRSAEDMARLLHCASRDSAAAFARAEHEKACAGSDQGCEAFWREVVELLANPAALAPTHPGPHHRAAEPPVRPARVRRLPRGMVRPARR